MYATTALGTARGSATATHQPCRLVVLPVCVCVRATAWRDDGVTSRSVFDLSFYLVITVTLLSIVSGVIIDSFGALRDRDNAVGVTGDRASRAGIAVALTDLLLPTHADSRGPGVPVLRVRSGGGDV